MEYHVVIPDEVFAILEWQRDGLPAICVVNQSLAQFEPKVVFAWHLSIIVDSVDLAQNGMPTRAEAIILDKIGNAFDKRLKVDGNALFLARITWNGTRQVLYRVYDPEIANKYLMRIINRRTQVREFDFRMEHDEAWEYADYYLSRWKKKRKKVGKPSPKQQLASFLAKYTPDIAAQAKAVLAKMRKLLPGAVEMVYDNYNFLVIGFGPTERPSEAVFSIVLAPRWVTLCFLWGAKLPDPQKILKGGGKQVRNIRLTDAADLDRPEVRALMKLALERNAKPFDASAKGRIMIKSISAKQRPRRPR